MTYFTFLIDLEHVWSQAVIKINDKGIQLICAMKFLQALNHM